MVTNKQRQRQLARAKWERQQGRRVEAARRQRTITIVVGIILGLVVVGLLTWLVLHIVNEENTRSQTPTVPTTSPTDLVTPTQPVQTTPSGADQSQANETKAPKASKSPNTPKKTGGNQ